MTTIQAGIGSAFTASNAFQQRPNSGEADARRASRTELTPDEERLIAQLQKRDREVRAHEQAHVAAGAGVVRGGPAYDFERGPDGRLYAVGGEVPIDTSPGRTPEETIDKARQIRAAALAPADPSPQDQRVAAAATQLESQARLELADARRAEQDGAARQEGVAARTSPQEAFGRGLVPRDIGSQINIFA